MFIDPDNLVCGGIPGGGLDVLRALFHYFPVQFLIRAEMERPKGSDTEGMQ